MVSLWLEIGAPTVAPMFPWPSSAGMDTYMLETLRKLPSTESMGRTWPELCRTVLTTLMLDTVTVQPAVFPLPTTPQVVPPILRRTLLCPVVLSGLRLGSGA